MRDTIYSASLLKNHNIPKEIDRIFKNCNVFLGDINVYKIHIIKEITIIITNIEKQDLSIYDMIEFLKISEEIKNKEDNNIDLIQKWKNRTIYLRKYNDEDYDYINFFDIFPSDNSFSLIFYFDFKDCKFKYSDKKGGPHFTENQLKYIERKINIKKDPFVKTPSESVNIDYFS